MDYLLNVINSCLVSLSGEPKRVRLSSATSLKDVYGMGRGDLKRTKEVYEWRDSTWYSIDEAARRFEQAGITEYNEFTPNSIRALKRIDPQLEVQLAREGSPCVYVRKDGADLEAISEMIEDSKKVGADEVHVRNNEIRLWWD
jgi:hypothetical protein